VSVTKWNRGCDVSPNGYAAFTLDTYSHIITEIQLEGTVLPDEVLPVPVDAFR
jgi:hypothetical protein